MRRYSGTELDSSGSVKFPRTYAGKWKHKAFLNQDDVSLSKSSSASDSAWSEAMG